MTTGGAAARGIIPLIVVAAMLVFVPTADAAPRNQLCNNESYRNIHVRECEIDGPLPGLGTGGTGGGGGSDGGLIDRILDAVGLGGLI